MIRFVSRQPQYSLWVWCGLLARLMAAVDQVERGVQADDIACKRGKYVEIGARIGGRRPLVATVCTWERLTTTTFNNDTLICRHRRINCLYKRLQGRRHCPALQREYRERTGTATARAAPALRTIYRSTPTGAGSGRARAAERMIPVRPPIKQLPLLWAAWLMVLAAPLLPRPVQISEFPQPGRIAKLDRTAGGIRILVTARLAEHRIALSESSPPAPVRPRAIVVPGVVDRADHRVLIAPGVMYV